jgi:uncharacterized protein (TIGR00288 family)
MAPESSRPDVAVFIDFENVYVSVRDKLDANPDFESIMDRCSELGRVVIARAYADWYRYPRVTSALYANSVEPMYVPTYYYDKDVGRTGRAIKNSADMNMCIDAMRTLFTNTNIAKFVLVTGDRDFIPLVNTIRQQGKDVIVIGIGGAASTHLAQSADEFIFYEQLVGRSSPQMEREAARARERARQIEAPQPQPQQPAAQPAPVERQQPPPAPVERQPPQPAEVSAPSAAAGEPDPFEMLVEAVQLARKRNYVSTLGSLKLVMKELMGGDFKESRYKDLNGRPFAKFKDFVQDAEARGKVQIYTNGTVNEVFLLGEDPAKLSQFGGAPAEEPTVEVKPEPALNGNGRRPKATAAPAAVAPADADAAAADAATTTSAGRSRRRRRSRGGRQNGQPADAPQLIGDELELEAPIDHATPDDLYDAQAGDEGTDAAETDLVEELFAPDTFPAAPHIIDPPVGAGVTLDLPDLEDDDEEAATESLPDQGEMIAESDEIEETAAALVAEIRAEEAEPEAAPAEEPQPAEEPAPPAADDVDTDAQPAAAPVLAEAEGEAEEALAFGDDEWSVFREMMRGFTKPVAFVQIFDGLRALRQQGRINRTNEQLRSLAKQAINGGMLERSGRGTRVYYRLPEE